MSMYFKSRQDAGEELAEILFHPYGRSKTVVLALNAGALLVAKPIAQRLEIPLRYLASRNIELPGDFHEVVGAVDETGEFHYSSNLSQGEIDQVSGEYHNYIDSQKTNAIHDMNQQLGEETYFDKHDLNGQNIILVSDGMAAQTELDSVLAFLKTIDGKRLVAAVPVASIAVIDKLHLVCDELRILSPKQNYMGTNHYYDENNIPNADEVEQILSRVNSPQLT